MFLANFPRKVPKFNVSRKSFESLSTKIKQILYSYNGSGCSQCMRMGFNCKCHAAKGLSVWLSWKNKSGKWLHTLCNCVFHFYLQIKFFHQSINETKFSFTWKERFSLQIHFVVIFWLWAISNSLIVIAHGQKSSAWFYSSKNDFARGKVKVFHFTSFVT